MSHLGHKHSEHQNRKKSLERRGPNNPAWKMIWVNNGIISTRIKPEDLSEWEKKGFVKGKSTLLMKVFRKLVRKILSE